MYRLSLALCCKKLQIKALKMEANMSDWSEYFEDFPEENPANWIGGRFDPQAAKEARAREAKLAREQAKLDAEIRSIIEKHSDGNSGK